MIYCTVNGVLISIMRVVPANVWENSLEVAPGTTLNDLMCPYSSKPMVGAMVARCLRSNTIGSDLPQNQATKLQSW